MAVKKPKKFSCFTPEQQAYYERLAPRQRAYVDYRSLGYGKADSYRKAGYTTDKNAGQNAWILEHKDKQLAELIQIRQNARRAAEVLKKNSEISQRVDALAQQKAAKDLIETVEGADEEQAKQIQFFRDIANGTIKTVRKTVYTNTRGQKSTKVEYISDVETRMKARRELDRILGVGKIVDIGKISAGGNVNIMIVDASKKDELADERNKVYMEMQEKTEEIDGEVVIVEKKGKGADAGFETVEGDPVEEETKGVETFVATKENKGARFREAVSGA